MPKETSPSIPNVNDNLADELARLSDYLEAMVESNKRIEDLLRILSQPVIEAAIPSVFKNSKQIRAYELSDGVNSTRQIAEIVGVDQKTISTWWRTWEKEHGIVEKTGIRGQFRRLYSLVDVVTRYSISTPTDSPETSTDDHIN